MGTLAPPAPLTEQQLRAQLATWREHLVEAKTDRSNCVLTIKEIRGELDRLLDEFTIRLAADTLR